MSLKTSLAALIGLAAELHAAGAVRTEHDTKFSLLRTGLDQANELADQAAAAATAPPAPGVAEFAELARTVYDLSLVVGDAAKDVQALVTLANMHGA